MEGTYEVLFGGRAVGKVQVLREGLYYRFQCRCKLSGEVVCKLQVSCGDTQENLGILVPMGNGFGLEKKLAVKRLGQGKPVFRILPNRAVLEGRFVPIKPEEPFDYIERLKDAYLARQDGELGAVIRENAGK